MSTKSKPRFHTAPSRLRKRDERPAVWDLFALDDRATKVDDDDASSVASLSHAASIASYASEEPELPTSFHSASFSGLPPYVDRGGSWPRIRKQRTSEGSMSLFEVAEALGNEDTSADADLASLAKLVAEEEEQAVIDETANVSIESFVDAVFCGQSPNAAASHSMLPPAPWAAPAPAAPPVAPVVALLPPPAACSSHHKAPARAHTANELALLEALKQDQANQAAAEGARRAATASPTFAVCAGALDLAGDAHDHADGDDVFAMLQIEMPSNLAASPALHPHGHPADAFPPHNSFDHHARAEYAPSAHAPSASFPSAYDPSGYAELAYAAAPSAPVGYGAPLARQDEHFMYDLSWGGYEESAAPPPHHGARSYHHGGVGHDAANFIDPADLSEEQLAGHLEHALGVPLGSLPGVSSQQASRAPTMRAPPTSRRQRGGAPPPHASFAPSSAHGYHPDAVLAPPPPSRAAHRAFEPPPLTAHLDAEALANIPTASIQPLSHPGVAVPGAAMAGAMVPPPPHSHLASAAAASQGVVVSDAVPPPAPPALGRNGAERKEWSVSEDNIIRESVLTHGCRWRRIAAQLPGRSDDAVRNRWNRLKEMGVSDGSMEPGAVQPPPAPPPPAPVERVMLPLPLPHGMAPSSASMVELGALQPSSVADTALVAKAAPPAARAPSKPHQAAAKGEGKPERVSWSKSEDDTILRGVSELGHKWNKIAERLPGRTDHAIRNRFHRLQSLLEDRQRQQQLVLAPNMPLPVPLAMHAHGRELLSTAAGVHSLITSGVEALTPHSADSSGGGFETPVGASVSPPGAKAGMGAAP